MYSQIINFNSNQFINIIDLPKIYISKFDTSMLRLTLLCLMELGAIIFTFEL